VRKEYEIIETLSQEYDVAKLCELAGVSRSGFYKWRNRPKGMPSDRLRILALVKEAHEAHPSHGYRWIHAYLANRDGLTCSPEYIRRAFKYLGVESKTKHKRRRQKRKTKDAYPNLVFSTWETVDRPRQVIVSDMTAFWTHDRYWELTMYFDVFTKQILGYGMTCRRGDNCTYYDGLEQVLAKLEGTEGEPTILHTDQGSVYTSKAYNEIIKEHNVVRSLSRAGKPTDNPVNESLNGWIKEELFVDFKLYAAKDVPAAIDEYVSYYNTERPSFALGYEVPDDYHKLFMAGGIERKDTFKDRVLDETPKFVREKRSKKEAG